MHANLCLRHGLCVCDAMDSVKEFPKSLKMFAKEVGLPEAIFADSHTYRTSKEVKLFCHKLGTTLMILEGSTQWDEC